MYHGMSSRYCSDGIDVRIRSSIVAGTVWAIVHDSDTGFVFSISGSVLRSCCVPYFAPIPYWSCSRRTGDGKAGMGALVSR